MSFDPVAALIAYHAALDAHDVDKVEGRDAITAAMRKYFATHIDHKAWDERVEQVAPNAARSVWQLTATNSANGEKYNRRGEEVVTFDTVGKVVRVQVTDY